VRACRQHIPTAGACAEPARPPRADHRPSARRSARRPTLLSAISCLRDRACLKQTTAAGCDEAAIRRESYRIHDPEVMSHVLMVSSEEALTRILGLSGLKATHLAQSLCPLSGH